MSEFILKDMVEKRGIQSQFEIASAATSTEEIWNGRGNPIYPPAQAELRRHGIGATAYTNFASKRARQVTREDYEYYDYIIAMDDNNVRNIKRIIGEDSQNKVSKLLQYAGLERGIADPWYTGNFDITYDDILEGCQALLSCFKDEGMI